jgi:hypothetical protein
MLPKLALFGRFSTRFSPFFKEEETINVQNMPGNKRILLRGAPYDLAGCIWPMCCKLDRLGLKDQVSHPYKTVYILLVFYIINFILLAERWKENRFCSG